MYNVFLCRHMFIILLGMCLGVELLGDMVILFNFLRTCQTDFYNHIYFYTEEITFIKAESHLYTRGEIRTHTTQK